MISRVSASLCDASDGLSAGCLSMTLCALLDAMPTSHTSRTCRCRHWKPYLRGLPGFLGL